MIYQQLQYVQTADPGVERDHVVSVPIQDRPLRDRYDAFREQLLTDSNVQYVTTVGHLPTNITSSSTRDSWDGSTEGESIKIYRTDVGLDVLDVFGIRLLEGRAPAPGMSSDTLYGVLINETAKQSFGWSDAIGKRIGVYDRVVGVVQDFHMHSFHQPIQPLMLRVSPSASRYVSMRIADDAVPATLEHIRQVYDRFSQFPFEYEFLDDAYAALYDDERRLGSLLGHLTILALLIASLGLFGLAAYGAERRTKEIGVRKVLGATVPQIVVMLGKEFTALVIIGALVALPLAYVATDQWLSNFAYRIDVSAGVLLLSVAASLLAAWLSVSYQSLKAARLDPANSLKYE